LELVVITGFMLINHFTSFFIRPAGPIPGAGRNQENPYEGHETRFAQTPRRPTEKTRGFHWGRDIRQDAKSLGKVVDTPTPCSCWMCGNPRRYFNESTQQERRAIDRERSFR